MHEWLQGSLEPYELPIAIAGAALVILVGTLLARRKRAVATRA
jgi:hypothetical protein